MRLNFTITVVDDDLNKGIESRECRNLKNMLLDIKQHIENKGFQPIIILFKSKDDCQNDKEGLLLDNTNTSVQHHNRIDLYLSDNNLLINDTSNTTGQNGINLYLELRKSKFLCDFVLYSRSETDTIVSELSNFLNQYKDPNLFTRFTFVARGDVEDTSWHTNIKNIINHIISSREEMNTLRGLFAHVTADMHHSLLKACKKESDDDVTFSDIIKIAHDDKLIDDTLKNNLHIQRKRRNDIVHNSEKYDSLQNEFYIPHLDNEHGRHFNGKLFRKNFPQLRTHLKQILEELKEKLEKNHSSK